MRRDATYLVPLKYRKIMVALVLLFTASSNTHPTLAIKPGLYERETMSTVLKEVGTADVKLECRSTDHIRISGAGVNPNDYYSLERVREILKSQKKRDLLVATLSKAYPGRYNKDALELENFKSFLSSLGYKRHLVVGSNGFGIEVLWDSKEPPSPTTDPEISQARALEEAFQASEWVGRVRYSRYETRGKVTLTNPPTAIFAPITCFKGPPISHNLTILFEFDPPETKEKQDNWKFNESMMPGPKSEWIIFIPNAVPVPGKGFITYRGSFGRMEATQKNVDALNAVIRRHQGEN